MIMTVTRVTCGEAILSGRRAASKALPMHSQSAGKARRLMAILAHPDDESLGFGGTLAKYAADGAEVFLLTATRGDGGRYRGHLAGDAAHPGRAALATIREA